ncbi:GMC family oxidoreductase [Rhodosalinus sediminis]|uniref:GMC family oxidoreductase n=1 Tax=Rhodosalinus sediminis TaxID=1940533 RepID=UPI002356365B|nr:GMC family oxidoreductase [Rhodosalinus sediminis]
MTPDVVIVGAGAGGGAAAWRLCTQGLRVLLLEAGPRFDPARDYSLTAPGWERRGFPDPPGSRAEITYGDLGALDPADADLASWNAVRGRLVDGARRAVAAGYAHVQGVGGSTLHYVGEAHRLHPESFALATRHGVGADWPLDYATLEPYYAACEAAIGVAGPAEGGGGRWRSGPYPLPPHPLSPAAAALATAGGRLGMTWEANARAALSRPYDGRPACNYCANCSRGCPLGDKGSTDVTFLRHAEATGNLVLRTGAAVTRLVPGPGGRIEAVEYVHDGRRARQETPVLVLAGGAVQTPRLLLASASAEQPEGLANGSGAVGRHFMETLAWRSAGLAPDVAMSHAGLPADAVSWDFNAPDGVPGAVGGCRFTSDVQESGLVGPIGYASRLVPGFGAAFKARLRARFGSAVSVSGLGAVLPDARSRVDLHPERTDAHGVPLPRIHSVLTANSHALLRFMAERARRLLSEVGVTGIAEESSSWDRFSATHVFGTCRMGTDPARSVVDSFGRAHDHPNLYIADASVFPSTGGGESPSLTIHALALRTADRIARDAPQ